MAIIKISFHLNMEVQLLCRSLSCTAGESLERCILYIYWAISHSNQKSIVTFKFHRPPRMSVMPPSRGSAPIGGSFYLANHPLFDKTIDSTLFCSLNEMHFKCYAFWSFKTFFLSPWSQLLVGGSAAFQHLGLPSVHLCVFIALCSCTMKTKLPLMPVNWLKAFGIQGLES